MNKNESVREGFALLHIPARLQALTFRDARVSFKGTASCTHRRLIPHPGKVFLEGSTFLHKSGEMSESNKTLQEMLEVCHYVTHKGRSIPFRVGATGHLAHTHTNCTSTTFSSQAHKHGLIPLPNCNAETLTHEHTWKENATAKQGPLEEALVDLWPRKARHCVTVRCVLTDRCPVQTCSGLEQMERFVICWPLEQNNLLSHFSVWFCDGDTK